MGLNYVEWDLEDEAAETWGSTALRFLPYLIQRGDRQ